jgi:hypothetical protein
MGFKLKNIIRAVSKPFAKAIDPLLPESVKKGLDKLDARSGDLLAGGAFGAPTSDPSAPTATGTTVAQPTGAISEEEAQAVAQKRLARLGKYFTSPLGVLGNASTASQKVFS